MSLPSLFDYMPDQARVLCKAAALDPRPLIRAIPAVSAGVGGLAGGFQEREQGLGGIAEGAVRGAVGAGLGSLIGYHVGGAGGMTIGALTGINSAGPLHNTEAHMEGAVNGGEAVGNLVGGVLGATKGYRLMLPAREKTAEEVERTSGEKARGVAKAMGTGLLGFATGSLAGVGSAYLADKWYEAATGKKIPLTALHAAAPILGGAAGIAYNLYQAKQQEELRRALASKSDRPQGRIPPK